MEYVPNIGDDSTYEGKPIWLTGMAGAQYPRGEGVWTKASALKVDEGVLFRVASRQTLPSVPASHYWMNY